VTPCVARALIRRRSSKPVCSVRIETPWQFSVRSAPAPGACARPDRRGKGTGSATRRFHVLLTLLTWGLPELNVVPDAETPPQSSTPVKCQRSGKIGWPYLPCTSLVVEVYSTSAYEVSSAGVWQSRDGAELDRGERKMRWESVSNWLGQATQKVGTRFRALWRVTRWVLLLGLVLVAVLIVTLVATHICLVFQKSPPVVLRWLPDFILGLLFGSSATLLQEDRYGALVSDMIAAFAFVVTVATVLQAALYKRKVEKDYSQKLTEAKSDYAKKTGISAQAIRDPGNDDLIWMVEHYREGDEITIFGVGFEWLKENQEMREIVSNLAHQSKLRLVSYKPENAVKQAFERAEAGDLFRNLRRCFRYSSETGKVVCTMIKKSETEWKFLYKSRPDRSGHAFNACVLNDTDSTRELLHILAALTNADHWGI
jgi:hypothetical protein